MSFVGNKGRDITQEAVPQLYCTDRLPEDHISMLRFRKLDGLGRATYRKNTVAGVEALSLGGDVAEAKS